MRAIIVISIAITLCLESFSQKHKITIDSSQRVVSIQLQPSEYDTIVKYNLAGISEIQQEIYQKFDDKFDFIFLLLNEKNIPASIKTSGYCGSFINRIGVGLTSQTNLKNNLPSAAGSDGFLKANIVLSSKSIMSGPSLHELLHTWANFGIPASYLNGNQEIDANGHWGFTGGSTPGQLGGFLQSSLQTNVAGNSNQYSVKAFGWNANGGNSVPYNMLELYLMGMIPINQVPAFDGFTGLSQQINVGNNLQFTATKRVTYDSATLISVLGGPRIPSSLTAQKNFRALIVVVTKEPLSSSDWTYFADESERFGRSADEGTPLLNFWEATDGLGKMQTDNLSNAIRNCAIVADTNNACSGTPINFNVILNNNFSALTYQWTRNSIIIPNASLPTLKITLDDGDTIRCIVNKGLSNQAISNFFIAHVYKSPTVPIISPVGPLTLCAGDSITLTGSVTGGSNQWYKNGVPVEKVPNYQKLIVKDSGTYYLNIANTYNLLYNPLLKISCGVTSSPVVVKLNTPISPTITTIGPSIFCSGDSTILTSSATNGNQWSINGNPINGANGQSYTVKASGNYYVSITNTCGISISSASKTVTVNPLPSKPIISWNGNQFSTASGLSLYQWYLNGIPINGAAIYTYMPTVTGSFKVDVYNNFGCKNTSDSYQLVVTATPSISPFNSGLYILYPNPATNEVWIELPESPISNTKINLLSGLGMILQSFHTNQKKNKVQLQGLAKGLYYLEVNNGKYKHTISLIIN